MTDVKCMGTLSLATKLGMKMKHESVNRLTEYRFPSILIQCVGDLREKIKIDCLIL